MVKLLNGAKNIVVKPHRIIRHKAILGWLLKSAHKYVIILQCRVVISVYFKKEGILCQVAF